MTERKAQFLKYISTVKALHEREKALYELGFDAINFSNDYYVAMRALLGMAFTEAQIEIIEWWLYEDVDKVITWPSEGRSVRLDTAEQLLDYLERAYD